MSQLSFSDAEAQAKRKQTRREKFLFEIDKLLPWNELERPVVRYYSKSLRGRKLIDAFQSTTGLTVHEKLVVQDS